MSLHSRTTLMDDEGAGTVNLGTPAWLAAVSGGGTVTITDAAGEVLVNAEASPHYIAFGDLKVAQSQVAIAADSDAEVRTVWEFA